MKKRKHIPAIFSLSARGEDALADETPFIMVERLIQGKSWDTELDNRSVDKNVETLITVSRAVAYAHKEGIIHGDLKPENVMLGAEGDRFNEIYIVDWGLAQDLEEYKRKYDDQKAKLCVESTEKLTQTNDGRKTCNSHTAVELESEQIHTRFAHKPGLVSIRGGTPCYMPPEMVDDNEFPICTATDVFMLGGILCRILTGKAPRQDECMLLKPIEIFSIVLKAPMPELSEVRGKKISEELSAIARKALARHPDDRYPDAEAFAKALERYRSHLELRRRLKRAEMNQAAYDASAAERQNRAPIGDASPKILDLIENTNELRLIRETLAEMDSTQKIVQNRKVIQRNSILWKPRQHLFAEPKLGVTRFRFPIVSLKRRLRSLLKTRKAT